MKTNIISFILLILALTACSSAQPVDIQGTAVVLAKTGVALTQTAQPTATLPPTVTPTATITYPSPSPYPTQKPLPIFTPDAILVERWTECQTELAKIVLSGYGSVSKYALCEWDILGRSGQEVYVWAFCIERGANGSHPAVIYLEKDGAIRDVRIARYKGDSFDLSIFPEYVQEKCDLYLGYSLFDGRIKEMIEHVHYRETHPEIPPLVVLSAISMP
mgnify:FL=1